MENGKIIKIQKKYAVLLSDSFEFINIKIKDDMKIGQHIYYDNDNLMTTKHNEGYLFKDSRLLKVVFACIISVLLLVSIVNVIDHPIISEVFAVVTVDINPSIELEVDKSGIVLNVKALNEDAQFIVSEAFVGSSIEIVLEDILLAAKNYGYLIEEDTIFITSTKLLEKNSKAVDEKLDEFMTSRYDLYEFLYYKGVSEELDAAKSEGLSLGKYTLLEIAEDDITKEEIKELKMTEIVNKIKSNGNNGKALGKLKKLEINKIDNEIEIEDVNGNQGNGNNNALQDNNSKNDIDNESNNNMHNQGTNINQDSNGNNGENENDSYNDLDDVEDTSEDVIDDNSQINGQNGNTNNSNNGNNNNTGNGNKNNTINDNKNEQEVDKGKSRHH